MYLFNEKPTKCLKQTLVNDKKKLYSFIDTVREGVKKISGLKKISILVADRGLTPPPVYGTVRN